MADSIYKDILETVAQNTKMNRRAFMGFLDATGVLLVSGCTDKTEASGAYAEKGQAPYPPATNTPPSDAITDPHVKKRMLGGYEINGKRDIPGVGRVENKFPNPENMRIANGYIGTGDDDALDVIFSDDGKNLLIYPNEAAFKNNGGDIFLAPNMKGNRGEKIAINNFENVADNLYRYVLNIEKFKQKHNLSAGTPVFIRSADYDGDELSNAIARGGYAIARVVLE